MNKEYALYKGDELLDMGTLEYLSKKFNIKRKSLLFYQSPTYRRRTSDRKEKLEVDLYGTSYKR